MLNDSVEDRKSLSEPEKSREANPESEEIAGTGVGEDSSGFGSGGAFRQYGQEKSRPPLTLIPIPGVLPPSRLLRILDGGDGWGIEIAPGTWPKEGGSDLPESKEGEDRDSGL